MRSTSTLSMNSAANVFSGQLNFAHQRLQSRSDKINSVLDNERSCKKIFLSFGKSLRDKLYLASYDIMSVNLTSRPVYQLFQLLDFLFLAAYPLNHIYNYSKSARQHATMRDTGSIVGGEKREEAGLMVPQLLYAIPTNVLFEYLSFDTSVKVAYCLIAFILAVSLIILALVTTRETKRLTTYSPERKLTNKAVGLVVNITYYLMFVPVSTFSSRLLGCDSKITSNGLNECYQGSHMTIFIFVVLSMLLHLLLIMYSSTMLTTCYPNEAIPWAHFPSMVPFYRLAIRFPLVLVYQLDMAQKNTLVYFNAVFAGVMSGFIYARLTRATTFDQRIHTFSLISESLLVVLFLYAFIMDLIPHIPLDTLFSMILILTLLAVAYFVTKIQKALNERFVIAQVDIFQCTNENEALRMMIALHQLIELSAYSPREEFILRGFVERHIEICDYAMCNCLEYFKVINCANRLQMNTIASMREGGGGGGGDNNGHQVSQQNSNNQTSNNITTMEDEYSGDDMSIGGGGAGGMLYFAQSNNNGVRQSKSKVKFLHTFLINNIKVFIEMFPNSLKLRYMSAFIYFSLFKNSFKALYELSHNNSLLSSNKEISGNTGLAFICGCGKGGDAYNSYTLGLRIIEYFTSRVNQFLANEGKAGIDIAMAAGNAGGDQDLAKIIEFEKLNIKYQKEIEKTSEISERFWVELGKKGGLNIDTIFNLGANINQRFHSIKRKYKRLMSINQNYLEVAYLYKLFVQLCLNFELEESEAKLEITKILQSKGMRKRNLRLEYSRINFTDENGMIIISGCQSNFSSILAMNNKAERIFGYSTAELIDQPLQKLQPMVYTKGRTTPGEAGSMGNTAHDDFIMNYINCQKRRGIKKEQHRFVWGKHKSGFIMPIVMDISPYVTFEHNLCFISFCKRSILLEMRPLKEIIDAQDVFVLLADQRGTITDMTRNVTDWLGFPQTALHRKEVNLEKVFEGIMEDEGYKEFSEGKRIDFYMNSFKDALEDFENRSDGGAPGDGQESGEGAGDDLDSTLYMKDKKCRALVWMKIHEYQLVSQPGLNPTSGLAQIVSGNLSPTSGQLNQAGSLLYTSFGGPQPGSPTHMMTSSTSLMIREIWFVLLEEEAATATTSYMESNKENTHQTANNDKEELKFTYQEDREEISSLASISSLAGYNTTDKGLINKLSEIKTSTVEDQKPRSISILQQALVAVFILSLGAAVAMLALALNKNQTFYSQLELMNSAKMSSIKFQNVQLLVRELISLANEDQVEFTQFDLPQGNQTNGNKGFLQQQILYQAELFRNLLLEVDDPEYKQAYDSEYLNSEFKTRQVQLNYIRGDGFVFQNKKSYMLSLYELITACQDIGQAKDIKNLILKRDVLNYSPNSTQSRHLNLGQVQRQVYFFLNNSHLDDVDYYPMYLGQFFVDQAHHSISENNSVFLIIMIIAIAVTFLTAALIMPIIVRIESNKERVFFIYAELSKNDIDDRKRNIRLFFAKLRQSTLNPGGSLFYEKSSRIASASSKLMTRRFSENQQPGHNSIGLTKKNSGQGIGSGGGLVRQSAKSMGPQNQGGVGLGQMRSKGQNFASIFNPNNVDVDYEEDMQAEMMKQKEEQEAAAFKKFFHGRIRAMSCMKKIKHGALVFLIAALVQGYFIFKRELITNIETVVHDSLNYYQTLSLRNELFGRVITEYRESFARNATFNVPDFFDASFYANDSTDTVIDYFLEKSFENSKEYYKLRQSIPQILAESAQIINDLEGDALCNQTMKLTLLDTFEGRSVSQCQTALDGILQTGLTQTVNSMLKEIIQSQIAFDRLRYQEEDLRTLINNDKIRGIIYLKIIYLDSAMEYLLLSVKSSISQSVQTMERSLVIFFACFILLSLVGVSLTATLGMQFLYRSFNATKSILNFIPGKCLIELSDKTELKKIQF